MSQAKRIPKKTPKKKTTRSKKARASLPWGLISVVLICGVILGLLLSGLKVGDREFGVGIKEMMNKKGSSVEQDEQIAELIENKSSKKEFDFYELLPDIEKVMPDDLPESVPDRPSENLDYFLQAASFREHADAEKLRARLALKGFKSVTQAREVEGKGTYYRVRLGPYADKRKAKTAKNKLQDLGVKPFVFTVTKPE